MGASAALIGPQPPQRRRGQGSAAEAHRAAARLAKPLTPRRRRGYPASGGRRGDRGDTVIGYGMISYVRAWISAWPDADTMYIRSLAESLGMTDRDLRRIRAEWPELDQAVMMVPIERHRRWQIPQSVTRLHTWRVEGQVIRAAVHTRPRRRKYRGR